MRGVLILEAPDRFVVQGLAVVADERHVSGRVEKETYTFLDDDVARSSRSRGSDGGPTSMAPRPWPAPTSVRCGSWAGTSTSSNHVTCS
ncbi:MAG: hypothetical protein R3C32_13265 [Chloroflexota bacterium]